ncbi:hypothetical protein XH83_27765 [Bradyrhizobium sp. CCBAU 53351]|uniref:hypothetical protein n=1 Tax=Bradyrhizobium sp. CCBAU 53351 TaxID=1325114 RepID=UPI001889220C|nr:hypothetical protein [Bradyrhizobium sp. CCBAU 53351]QOZ78867.1 hypothetical protein XH83_27765 [Bradyrhizobium sp. CCBAU 53351]
MGFWAIKHIGDRQFDDAKASDDWEACMVAEHWCERLYGPGKLGDEPSDVEVRWCDPGNGVLTYGLPKRYRVAVEMGPEDGLPYFIGEEIA